MNTTFKTISISRTVLLLAPMVLALPFAMDIYVPALPGIARLFNLPASALQLTLTLFMLTAGILQLIIGPLSDAYGRKIICLFSILAFSLGSVLCASATGIFQLVTFRVIQALGAAGMFVIPFAIVRDLYHGIDSAKTYSYLNGIISFSPMFAPFIGSYLDVKFGWQSTFLSLLAIAIVSFFSVSFVLPESLPTAKRKKFSLGIFSIYKSILINPIFYIYTLFSAFGLSYLYLFCSLSPYLLIQRLHVPELHYGYYFCFMGISFFIGSFLSAYVVSKIGIFKTVFTGFILSIIGGIIMLQWYIITGLTLNNFIWPMLLIGIGGTFSMGAGNGGAMEPFANDTGAASALAGAIRFILSGMIGSIVITKNIDSTLPLAVPAIIFSIFGMLIFSYRRQVLSFNDLNPAIDK